LGTWEGTIDREIAVWLRFYDRAGNLVPLPEEAYIAQVQEEQKRAEQEKQRADRLAEQLRALGIDPQV
jgi:hypothetical protein